jgi:hypothetical protein
MNSSHLTPLIYTRQGMEDSATQDSHGDYHLDAQNVITLHPESAGSLGEETFTRLLSGPTSPFG